MSSPLNVHHILLATYFPSFLSLSRRTQDDFSCWWNWMFCQMKILKMKFLSINSHQELFGKLLVLVKRLFLRFRKAFFVLFSIPSLALASSNLRSLIFMKTKILNGDLTFVVIIFRDFRALMRNGKWRKMIRFCWQTIWRITSTMISLEICGLSKW